MNKRIAVIVPCFNEERRFPTEYWREILTVENHIKWLFVNDGSFDETDKILKEVCVGTSAQVVSLPRNRGKGNAIRFGLLEMLQKDSGIEVLGYLDSDGAFMKEDIFRISELTVQKLNESVNNQLDAVISSRVSLSGRQIIRKGSRHYLGRIIATLLTNKWNDSPYDTQSGYKLFFNSEAFRASIKNKFETRWLFDVEILTRIGIYNNGRLSIWEEPLFFWKDVDGSKLKIKHLYSIFLELFFARKQVLRFLKERSRQSGSN
jgi:glycosyltransferase involved in cell wall biosynthesis